MEKSVSSSQRRDIASPYSQRDREHEIDSSRMKIKQIDGRIERKRKVASGPTKQPFDELGGNTPGILVKLVNFIAHMCRLII